MAAATLNVYVAGVAAGAQYRPSDPWLFNVGIAYDKQLRRHLRLQGAAVPHAHRGLGPPGAACGLRDTAVEELRYDEDGKRRPYLHPRSGF